MSEPVAVPKGKPVCTHEKIHSPCDSPGRHEFLIPSPLPTKRTRTYSQSQRAGESDLYKGFVRSFCRQKGHGFVDSEDGEGPLFVHISDIDGEYVPREGDEVQFKKVLIPPKFEKHQAVHVSITHLKPGTIHETWTGERVPDGGDINDD